MLRLLLLLAGVTIILFIVLWGAQSVMQSPTVSQYAQVIAAEKEKAKIKAEPAETDPDKWRALLQQLSDLALSDEDIRKRLTADQIKKRWMGEAPATEEQIAAAERRLGVRLPPSYRAFLKVSNGWHYPNRFVARLAGTEEIGFTKDVDPNLINAWKEYTDEPETHLAETLLINVPSNYDDAASFMLNPATVGDGEMEAWFFSSWSPGADAHRSFWHLMRTQVVDWKFEQTMAASE